MLTQNYAKLTRNLSSVGCHVHSSTRDEFMTITIQRIVDVSDFVSVNEGVNKYVSVRLNVGKNDTPLYYKFDSDSDTFVIHNVPIYAGEEAWIAISTPNQYCVFGSVSKYSQPK